MYDYRLAGVVRVVDGDTVDVRIDVGFYLTTAVRVRVLGVDTPERGEPGWDEARVFCATWLAEHESHARITTRKADSFGRWLADIYCEHGHLSAALINYGHAKPYTR